MRVVASILWWGLSLSFACAAEPYSERYRPQYHFTPREGWIGDPDGTIRYQDTYHLFWWGHAISTDLVHWEELPWPMKGDDGSFAYFTGSVVVDERDTSGFGEAEHPAMVAVYTAHRHADGLQNQRISYSTDYRTFRYYAKNPVLDIRSTSFRDPDVFWHEPTGRWVMVIALPDKHTFQFYTSEDLKAWRLRSEFGRMGGRDGAWEVPHLFEIPVEGAAGETKWVLLCSVSPNRVQYFVGDFDGVRFTLDPVLEKAFTPAPPPAGDLVFDFERTLNGWTVQGQAFGQGPVPGALPGQMAVSGYGGERFLNSYHGKDDAEGNMTSPPFELTRDFLNFKIGGGRHPGTACVELLIDGEVVRASTGGNSEGLHWTGWDVSEWQGRTARVRVADRIGGHWGHVLADHFVLCDTLATDHAAVYWVDHGPDFYAARTFRDYDNAMSRVVMIGWMGNWEYANDVPTSWGRGAQSIPRELTLERLPDGAYRLLQRPLRELKSLRMPAVTLPSVTFRDVIEPTDFQPRENVYEIDVEFALDGSGQDVGVNLCTDGANKVAVGYDSAAGLLYLDRRHAGGEAFSPHFSRLSATPFAVEGHRLRLNIFVDRSSVEVFVNDGRAVMTAQVYPGANATGIQLFSRGAEAVVKSFTAWELASIWK